MKISLFITGLLFLGLVFTGSAFYPSNPSTGNDMSRKDSVSIPEGINKILTNSCLACHGEGGKPMALGKLNFSEWDGYSAQKKAAKAAAICKEVTEGTMPPKGFLKFKPEAALTKEQVDSVCMWTKTMPR